MWTALGVVAVIVAAVLVAGFLFYMVALANSFRH